MSFSSRSWIKITLIYLYEVWDKTILNLKHCTNIIILAETDWMACSKVAFDEFRVNATETIFVNITSDSETCIKKCSSIKGTKSYYYHDKTCKCLSRPYDEYEKHFKKLGAPKGCPITFKQKSCVSSQPFLLRTSIATA